MWSSSSISVALVAILFYITFDWHQNQSFVAIQGRQRRLTTADVETANPTESAWLDSADPNEQPFPDDNDDTNRDEQCRKYLVNFLNGTTDAADECQGFANAFKAANCQQDNKLDEGQALWHSFLQVLGFIEKRRHHTENGTIVDDDVVMDDFYESFECCTSIEDFYSKHCNHESLDAMKLFGITAALVICGVSKSLLRLAGLHWIPDAGACIIVGSIIGGTLRLFSSSLVNSLTFDNDLFLQILLPPIIFEAALTINKTAFRRDLFPILTLAILGTFFSAASIGYITYWISGWGSSDGLPLLDALLFGALMSSIDPVATLSILSSNGVRQGDTLYNLIFGESLLNDGVAIVLFNSLVTHTGGDDNSALPSASATLGNFLFVTLVSALVGIVFGGLCTLYFWGLKGQHSAVTEVAMFFTWALIPYYIADGIGCSGIISIMTMGFMLDFFVVGGATETAQGTTATAATTWMNFAAPERQHTPLMGHHRNRLMSGWASAFSGHGQIQDESRHHVGFVAEVISNLMETAIFGYLGLFLFNDKSFKFGLLGTGLFSCVVSRGAMVFLACLLVNIFVFFDVEELLGQLWHYMWTKEWRAEETPPKIYLDSKTQMVRSFVAYYRGSRTQPLTPCIHVGAIFSWCQGSSIVRSCAEYPSIRCCHATWF